MIGPAAREIQHPTKIFEDISVEKFYNETSIGLYWGHSGFMFGPGFKAWAKDFPVGTRIRVTAEITLPGQTS